MIFLGIDLGWLSQPSGVARISWDGSEFHLEMVDRLARHSDVLDWVAHHVGDTPAMLAIDAPLVIPNASGIRDCERRVNAEFSRYHAGCHPAHQGRPFYAGISRLVAQLKAAGYQHAAGLVPQQPGRYMIEVHPHAAHVNLFGLDRILKYKRGTVAQRARELARFRELLATLVKSELPRIPSSGRELKAVEDQLDAVLAAYVGARWYLWGEERSHAYGDVGSGYIVIPRREAPDPIALFREWLRTAEETGMRDANAMTLATASADGTPSARMVLLKGCEEGGFVFFTNHESRKGEELEDNPKAALVFHWRELNRQIRLCGTVARVSRQESADYFATRPRGSQLGAWASRQSRELPDRQTLEAAVAAREREFAGRDVPLPEHWGGYRLVPDEIEFWQGRSDRLHERRLFRRNGSGHWQASLLWP